MLMFSFRARAVQRREDGSIQAVFGDMYGVPSTVRYDAQGEKQETYAEETARGWIEPSDGLYRAALAFFLEHDCVEAIHPPIEVDGLELEFMESALEGGLWEEKFREYDLYAYAYTLTRTDEGPPFLAAFACKAIPQVTEMDSHGVIIRFSPEGDLVGEELIFPTVEWAKAALCAFNDTYETAMPVPIVVDNALFFWESFEQCHTQNSVDSNREYTRRHGEPYRIHEVRSRSTVNGTEVVAVGTQWGRGFVAHFLDGNLSEVRYPRTISPDPIDEIQARLEHHSEAFVTLYQIPRSVHALTVDWLFPQLT
jgi:hypothetical protein